MAKNRIKVYWLLLITLLYTAGIVLSVGEAQARYDNTIEEDTVIVFPYTGITSNCLVTEDQTPVRVILGEMSLYRPTQATFWLYSAGADAVGAVAWGCADEAHAEYVNLSLRSGTDVLEPYAEVDLLKDVKMDLTLVITPTEKARITEHPEMNIDVLVTWGEEMWGQFQVTLPEVVAEEETEPTEETDPTEENLEEELANMAEEAAEMDALDEDIEQITDSGAYGAASASAPEGDADGEAEDPGADAEEDTPEDGDSADPADNDPNLVNDDDDLPEDNGSTDSADGNNGNTSETGDGADPGNDADGDDPEGDGDAGSTENENNEDPENNSGSDAGNGTEDDNTENDDPEGSNTENDDPEDTGDTTPDDGTPAEKETVETLARIDPAGVLPIKLALTEEATLVRLGLWSGDNEDGESTEIALKPFPDFTKHRYADIKGYDMMYDGSIIEYVLEDTTELLVMLDFTQTTLAAKKELVLAMEIYAGDALLENHKISVTSDVQEAIVAAVLTEEELAAKRQAAEEGIALAQNSRYTAGGQILNRGQVLEVELPKEWREAEMEYSLELLTMTDSSRLVYQPVSLATNYWDVDYINDGKYHNLLVQLGSVLPQAGTYRLTMKWSYEGICYTQTQMTFFINYSAPSGTVLGS